MSKIQKAIDALDGCDEYSLRHHISEVSILIEGYAEAQSELAALREELAELGERYAKMQTGEDKMLHRVIAERDAAEQRNAELEVFERFAGYLLDHCEGSTIYEESLQYWLSESIKMYKPTESGASE